MIFGEKSTFAIDADENTLWNGKFIGLRLFVDNLPIGSVSDLTMVNSFTSSIRRFIEIAPNLWSPLFFDLSDSDIFQEVFFGDLLEEAPFILSLGEAFDDFSIVAYHDSATKTMKLLWQLTEKPFFKYAEDYPKQVLVSKINILSIKKSTEDFKSWFDIASA